MGKTHLLRDSVPIGTAHHPKIRISISWLPCTRVRILIGRASPPRVRVLLGSVL